MLARRTQPGGLCCSSARSPLGENPRSRRLLFNLRDRGRPVSERCERAWPDPVTAEKGAAGRPGASIGRRARTARAGAPGRRGPKRPAGSEEGFDLFGCRSFHTCRSAQAGFLADRLRERGHRVPRRVSTTSATMPGRCWPGDTQGRGVPADRGSEEGRARGPCRSRSGRALEKSGLAAGQTAERPHPGLALRQWSGGQAQPGNGAARGVYAVTDVQARPVLPRPASVYASRREGSGAAADRGRRAPPRAGAGGCAVEGFPCEGRRVALQSTRADHLKQSIPRGGLQRPARGGRACPEIRRHAGAGEALADAAGGSDPGEEGPELTSARMPGRFPCQEKPSADLLTTLFRRHGQGARRLGLAVRRLESRAELASLRSCAWNPEVVAGASGRIKIRAVPLPAGTPKASGSGSKCS